MKATPGVSVERQFGKVLIQYRLMSFHNVVTQPGLGNFAEKCEIWTKSETSIADAEQTFDLL